MHIPDRQLPMKEFLLQQHMEGIWCCMFELLQFALPLQCAPMSCAALANRQTDRYDLQSTLKDVLQNLQAEWEMVLAMEAESDTGDLLRKACPHTLWQSYRELLVTLEEEKFRTGPRSLALIEAWIPRVNNSSNVEQCFGSLADAVRRSGKSDCGSLANMTSVHVRACHQKVCGGPGQGSRLSLSTEDFEGGEVRGLRPKLFQPQSFTGSPLSRVDEFIHKSKPRPLPFENSPKVRTTKKV